MYSSIKYQPRTQDFEKSKRLGCFCQHTVLKCMKTTEAFIQSYFHRSVRRREAGSRPSTRLKWMYTISGRSKKRVKVEIGVSCVQQREVRGQRVKAELTGSSSKDHASRKRSAGAVRSTHSLANGRHVVQTQQAKVSHTKQKSAGCSDKELKFQMQTKQHI